MIFAEESTILKLVAGEKDCFVDLKIVAIGGGGGGIGNGASGSGFVESTSVRISENNSVAEITVGQLDESSKVEIGGELVLEALPGQIGQFYTGGAGYSGGGATGGEGGSNGSNGGNSSSRGGTLYWGGQGSGLDLSLVSMRNFILSPGAGGQPVAQFGGGGGGVVVNGKMPVGGNSGNKINYVGNGFGGGSGVTRKGFPGCILVEIEI